MSILIFLPFIILLFLIVIILFKKIQAIKKTEKEFLAYFNESKTKGKKEKLNK